MQKQQPETKQAHITKQMIEAAKQYASMTSGGITVNDPEKYSTFRDGQESGYRIAKSETASLLDENQRLKDSNRELKIALHEILTTKYEMGQSAPYVEKLLSIAKNAINNAKQLNK